MLKRVIDIPLPKPLEGKTFCLFGNSENTEGYYRKVGELTDELAVKCGDTKELLSIVQGLSKRRRYLRSLTTKGDMNSIEGYIVCKSNELLAEYTKPVVEHLQKLSLREKFNRTISTSREQYHLYMLEIEVTNRLNREAFLTSDYRVALLPHCLRDWTKNCKASTEGYDYVCKACSKKCYINAVSKILEEDVVVPYIWMEADLKSMFRKLMGQKKTVGVLGIACIPELVNGMRRCAKYGVPAVGVPLNANRCRRWMGEFYENSVELAKVEGAVNGRDNTEYRKMMNDE